MSKKAQRWFKGRIVDVEHNGCLFKPHRYLHQIALVKVQHLSASGIVLPVGYAIKFHTKERRDAWLRSQGYKPKGHRAKR